MPLWPWSSSPTPPPHGQSATPPPSPPNEPTPAPTEQSKRTPTRDELADLEFRQLFIQLNDPTSNSTVEDPPAASPNAPRTITSPPSFSATDRERIAAAKKAEEAYESTFPTEMNCLHAFDQVWYCYSLGGQFSLVYRYGSLRDCSTQSADWRFCMRTKVYGDTTRRAMILQHYKQKAAKYKQGPSSEDIWSIRTVPVEDAFTGWTKGEASEDGVLVSKQS
ncbi:hypothetical protein L211DRAFT_835634 [Terfezia boudieri ATCC MYA-4762]|uniref:Early meiotic induction protein 1 n=1 Tax=Terfezia boudieri ATCC MYA-4762 TaxID=1051890 RepID=A0A3N4M016_9PEZI|nr:hypothetical protein L211DRAFT_835634 [Terfezia boudieri ATCC MYA-4762]